MKLESFDIWSISLAVAVGAVIWWTVSSFSLPFFGAIFAGLAPLAGVLGAMATYGMFKGRL